MKSYMLFIFIVVAVLDGCVLGLRTHKHSVDEEDDSSHGHARKWSQDGLSVDDAEHGAHADGEDGAEVLGQIVRVFSDTFNIDTQEPENRPRSWFEKKPQTLEITANTVLRAIEKLLSSSKVKKITRDLARKAAVVYRAIEKEF